MIDIESKVFTTVYDAVGSLASVYGENIDAPASFPCIQVIEESNAVDTQAINKVEETAKVMYSVNIYSAKQNGKKAEAKQLRDIVDSAMSGLNFTRSFCQPIPNEDRTVYRIQMRYTAIVRAPQTIGGDTVYQIIKG